MNIPIKKILYIILFFSFHFNMNPKEVTFTTIKIGFSNQYPAIFEDTDKITKGFIVDTLNIIGISEKIEFKFLNNSLSDCITKLESGDIDIILSTKLIDEKYNFINYSKTPIFTTWPEVYVRNDLEIYDLNNKSVGIQKDDPTGIYFFNFTNKADIKCIYLTLNDYDEIFKSINSNLISAGVVTSLYGMLKHKKFGLVSAGILSEPINFYFASNSGLSEKYLLLLDKYIEKFKSDDFSVLNKSKAIWTQKKVFFNVVLSNKIKYLFILLILIAFSLLIFMIHFKFKLDYKSLILEKYNDTLKESDLKFRNYVNNSPDALFVTDENGNFLEINNAATKITGFNESELLQMNIKDLITSDFISLFQTAFASLKLNNYSSFEFKLMRKDNKIKWILMDLVKLSEIKLLLFAKDINQKKEYELTLLDNQSLLKEVGRIASIGGWEYNYKTEIMKWSSEVFSIFEVDNSFSPILKEILNFFDTNSKNMLELSISNAIKFNTSFDLELLLITLNGKNIFIHLIGKPDSANNRIIGIMQNITEQKTTIIELEKNKRLAEGANNAKSDFMANMSHEIRTPLNGIIGFTELLKHTKLTDEQKMFLNNIDKSSDFLLNTIEQILNLSLIDAGKIEIRNDFIDIKKVIHQSIDSVKFSIETKDLELTTIITDSVPFYIYSDDLRLNQILINLIGNAIKFTNKGKITITVDFIKINNINGKFRFTIEDTGIGISKADIEKITLPFIQLDSSINRQYEGSGLGLTIVKGILNSMNSDITVESTVGIGSIFSFTLVTDYKYDSTKILADNQNKSELLFHDIAIKILVVEDNRVNMMLTRVMISKIISNPIIIEAIDGIDAVEKYKIEKPNLIFMDIQMPRLDGFGAVIEIREYEQTNNLKIIPIIAMTADVFESVEKKCFETGMNGFIKKPISEKVIRDVFENLKF